MLRFTLSRRVSWLALALPLALAASACSDAGATDGAGGDAGGAGGAGSAGDGAGGAAHAGSRGSGGIGTDDQTAPTVVSNHPFDAAEGAATTTDVRVTFSEAMAASALDATTFSLELDGAPVPGKVSYFNDTAIFLPTSALALGTKYVATISQAATDVAGNPLSAPHAWSFTTDTVAPAGPVPVALGAASRFTILAKAAISSVPTSAITGDVGLSPAAASYITGFSLTRAGTKWTSSQVVGGVFAADNDAPTPSDLTTAVGDMEAAYTDAASRPLPEFLDLGGGAIGGMTLTPGLHRWNSAVTIASDVTLSGAPNDTWIFQVTGDLKMSAAKKVILSGGARARNVVWQVSGAVDFGATSHFEGVLLSKTAIKLGTGASVQGRLLAQTAVDIDASAVTAPAP